MRTRSVALVVASLIAACGCGSDYIGSPVAVPVDAGLSTDSSAAKEAGVTVDATVPVEAEARVADPAPTDAAACNAPSAASLAGTGCAVLLQPSSPCAVSEYAVICGANATRALNPDPRCIPEPQLSSGGALCCPCAEADGGPQPDVPVVDTACVGKLDGTPCCPGASDPSECAGTSRFVCSPIGCAAWLP